jgi:hypothetical protein
MAMKLVKRTAAYSIFRRGDDRYAVMDAKKMPVGGEDKVRILLAEGLVQTSTPGASATAGEAPVNGENSGSSEIAPQGQ